MRPSAHHHVGIRVADMNRSMRFYADVFEAVPLTLPFLVEGEFAGIVTNERDGASYRVAILRVGDGVVELFEFVHPQHPIESVQMTRGNILHFCVQVDDVTATLAKLEASGGRRLWPEIVDLGDGAQVIYAVDPDENIVEVINVPMDVVARLMIEVHPDADPVV